jgi:plasmid stability protein
MDPEMKRLLEERARRDGRSLSEEAKLLLNRGLGESRPGRPIGTALVELFRAVGPVEIEVDRHELPRVPPDFE